MNHQKHLLLTNKLTNMKATQNTIRICEHFHSIQGEGATVGKVAVFLRLSGCNLDCSWCDSKYHKKAIIIEISDLAKKLNAYKCSRLVITGGEPLIQQKELIKLLGRTMFKEIEIETNGTYIPGVELDKFITQYNVSVKLSNSNNKEELRLVKGPLYYFSIKENAIFKFVVDTKKDLKEIEDLMEKYPIKKDKVYLMPEGIDRAIILKKSISLIETCKALGVNFSPRLHVMIWNNKRAV